MIGLLNLHFSKEGFLLVCIAVTLIVPLVRRFIHGRFDPFEPLVVFVAAYGVMFVVRPTAMLLENNLFYERPSRTIDVSDAFLETLTFGLLGAVAFVTAYSMSYGKHLATKITKPPDNFRATVAGIMALWMTVAGLSIFSLFLISAGGIQALGLLFQGRSLILTEALKGSSYFWHASFVLVPATFILFVVARTQHNLFWTAAAFFVAILLLVRAAPIGSRMLLLPFFGGGVVYYYLAKGIRPKILFLLVIIVTSLFASSFFLHVRSASYRQEVGVGEIFIQSVTDVSRIFEPLTSGEDSAMVPLLAAALQVVPEEFSYTYGVSTLGDFFLRPIPRQWWPGKPLAPREKITAILWPREYAAGIINPEFSNLLYFYMDFGVVGIVVGMIIYGIVARGLYEYFLLHQNNKVAQLLFSLSLPFVPVALRDSPIDTFVRAVFIVLPVWIIFQFAAVRSSLHVSQRRVSHGSGRVLE